MKTISLQKKKNVYDKFELLRDRQVRIHAIGPTSEKSKSPVRHVGKTV